MKTEEKIDTRQAIVNSARLVFTEKGYRGASIREIAAGAGTAKPAIYYYFGSKAGLYEFLLKKSLREVSLLLREAAAGDGDPLAKLERLVEIHLDRARRDPETVRLIIVNFYRCDDELFENVVTKHVLEMLEITAGVIREGVDRGIIHPRDPLELAMLLMGMIHVQVLAIIKGRNLVPLSRPETIIETFIKGIGR